MTKFKVNICTLVQANQGSLSSGKAGALLKVLHGMVKGRNNFQVPLSTLLAPIAFSKYVIKMVILCFPFCS